ncbi:hypothetical protein [Yoonia sp. BS5-3]|uniref:Restriction endonuclease n=1 Tax=Yoonia phaeophyticola TaxID=3137369 RepID=A0ABZ2VAE9_9RHOB
MEKTFARDEEIFGSHTAESIASIFELFVGITGGIARNPNDPTLLFLNYFAGDDTERGYGRGLCRSADENFGFSPPIWVISFKYKLVHCDKPWDIEASYRTFKKNGRSNGSRRGRFYLTEIYVADNSGISNHVEQDFLKVVERLYEIQNEDETDAWLATMSAKGYVKGPQFSSYEDLLNWDLSNTRPHVRRRSDQGYQVFFADRTS